MERASLKCNRSHRKSEVSKMTLFKCIGCVIQHLTGILTGVPWKCVLILPLGGTKHSVYLLGKELASCSRTLSLSCFWFYLRTGTALPVSSPPIPGENPHPVGIQSFWRKQLTQVAQLGQWLKVLPGLPPQTPLLRTVYTMDWELCAWIQFHVNTSLPHTWASATSEQGRKILLTCIFPKASLRSTQ